MMEIAIKIHKCLTNGSNAHELLDMLDNISGKDALASVNEYFMHHFDKTPNEFITDKYEVDEVYAISSKLKYIREPNPKNLKKMYNFFEKIGYSQAGEA